MEKQLAKVIYHKTLSVMKFTLEMEETHYELGREDSRYKFFRKMLMEKTYDSLRELFEHFNKLELIEKTDYPEDVKNGWKETESGGSGFLNTADLNDFFSDGNDEGQECE